MQFVSFGQWPRAEAVSIGYIPNEKGNRIMVSLKSMKNRKLLLIVSAMLVVASAAAWIASAFYGLPWKEKAVAAKLENYLEKRYEKDFTLKESFYNFKDGSYGGWFYPAGDPELEFHAEEGFAEYTYVDNYPEEVWARQLKEAVHPLTKGIFPKVSSVSTGYVTYESLDIVKGPEIPPFDQAGAMLSVRVEEKEAFNEKEEQWQKVAELVKAVQDLSTTTEVMFNFIDKKKGIETFMMCPPKTETEISTVQQAKKACSSSHYDLETSALVDD